MDHRADFVEAFRAGSRTSGAVCPIRCSMHWSITSRLCGTPAQLDSQLDKLRQYAAVGLDPISLRLYANPAVSLRLLGERVVPALRDR